MLYVRDIKYWNNMRDMDSYVVYRVGTYELRLLTTRRWKSTDGKQRNSNGIIKTKTTSKNIVIFNNRNTL